MTISAPSRPRINRFEVEADLRKFQIDQEKYPLLVFGYRGYYLNSMGRKGLNDRSMYDDCIGLISPGGFLACNGNTDPTAPESAVEGRASLLPGFWPMWRLDLHRGKYLALCQRLAPCAVRRDGTEHWKQGKSHSRWGRSLGNGKWTGYFGINCHRGGATTTSSEGCQTVPEPQWSELIQLATGEAKRLWKGEWDRRCIPYALIDKGANS